jgi:hypothetical protein
MFGFAGIYTYPSEQYPGGTAAIIATGPNQLMVPIHIRMRVMRRVRSVPLVDILDIGEDDSRRDHGYAETSG